MNFFAVSRNSLSLVTLLAAGTLSASPLFAADSSAEREEIFVDTEAALRAALSEKYQPEGSGDEGESVYHDNADIVLTNAIEINTTKTEEATDADSGSEGVTVANNVIVVLASGTELLGGGNTVSSSEIDIGVKGSGDIFFLEGVLLSAENITFTGTTDSEKKTGRVFTTSNLSYSKLNLGPGTVIENRRLVADESTNYRAQGGAVVSAHIMDEVALASSASGNISFSGNQAFGAQISSTDSSGDSVTETFDAAGGAVFASGLLSVSGAGETLFNNNAAISEAGTAFGGAVFVANANLNSDGSLSSSSVYPDSVIDETGTKKFGLQVDETTLRFSGNSAQGANAQGGAVAVSGGYFEATQSSVEFLKNIAKNTAAGGKVFGGALQISDDARVGFDAETKLSFENNRAEAGAEQVTVGGGAIAVSDSTLLLAGTTTFSGNSVTSAFGGSSLSGGAFYVSGTLETVKDSDGTTSREHTTEVTLAGTVNFSQNEVSASALSSEKITGTDENPKTEIVESSAQGGAIALLGGSIVSEGNLSSLTFSGNFASAKTFAQGGAIASLSEETALALSSSSDVKFEGNSAKILSLDAGETQTDGVVPVAQGGAIYISAGTLSLDAQGELAFSENEADASAQGSALARGGAIFQSAGTLTLGPASFLQNQVVARVAQGGAIYAAGGEMNFTDAKFSLQNQALAGTETDAAGTTFARGGAIFAENSATLNFSGTTEFSLSSAYAKSASESGTNGMRSGAAGGAIYSAGTLNFDEVSFFNGSAVVSGDTNGAAFGAAVYIADGVFSAESLRANQMSALALGDAHGGAIYTASAGLLDVSGDFTLSYNICAGNSTVCPENASGGAVYAAGTMRVGGDFSAKDNSVYGKKASGGAIAVASGSVVISGTGTHEISSNKATSFAGDALGGAISVEGGTFRQTAGTLALSGNTATATGGNALGGAIHMRGGNVVLTNADVSGNSVGASSGDALGGAIYIDSSRAGTLTLFGNTTLSGNTANGLNDGIYVGAGTQSVEIIFDTNATLTENEDGSVTRSDAESATISDKITADGATLTLTKSGAGDLNLGEITSLNDAKISMNFNGGVSDINGDVASLEKLFVAAGAEVSLMSGTIGGYKSAEIAGTFYVASGATWNFSGESALALSGALLFDGATAEISGAAVISGAGTFFVKDTTFKFSDGDASLSAATISVGSGMFKIDGAGTLNVTEKLIFTAAGDTEIELNGATLGLVAVAHTAKGEVSAKISGTGTLIVYSESDGESIVFPEFSEIVTDEATGEETTTVYNGAIEIGSGISLKAGVSVGDGVSLKLSDGSMSDGSRNVLLEGGTLLTEANGTLNLESLSVSGDAVSVLGAAGENQTFRMTETTTTGTDEDGNPTEEKKTAVLSLTGNLEITESTTFVGNAVLARSSALSGDGTIVGDVSGSGTLSVAKVDGNIGIANGSAMRISGSVSVTGEANIYTERTTGTTANAQLYLAQGASLSAAKFNNFGRVFAEAGTTISGNFVNAGTLSVEKDSTLTFGEASSFSNGYSDATETLAGTLDLSAENSAVDFSAIADETKIVLDNGIIRINAVNLQAGEALPIIGIEDESIFENLKIEDVNDYSLDNRFTWDAAAGELIFLGLNGERFRGTLYGDLQRESVDATYDFMRAAQFRGSTRTITPELYGVYKLKSPYMRGYIEKVRQRGGEISEQLEARRKAELAIAEKLNSRLVNFWSQADFSFGEQRSRKGFEGYDTTKYGFLVGASLPLENWEFGLVLGGNNTTTEMTSAGTRHEVDTDASGLSGYALYKNDYFDCIFGAAGMLTSSDSERGEYSGDFDGWRLGAMTEIGLTLRAQSRFAIRSFAGISAAYAHVGSFSESGGEGALSLDSDGAAGVRLNVGSSAAFLLSDTLQLKVYATWLIDFGSDTCSLDAYMPGTHTRYVIDSRENESSTLETGASLGWTLDEDSEIYLGYKATIGAGERVNGFSLGYNYFF